MLTIRLSRTGKRKQPYYRIVLQEKSRDPWSPAIEVLGQMNPRLDRSETVLKEDRIKYWISKGAEVSKGLHNLFIDKGLVKGEKLNKISLTASRRKTIEDAKEKVAKAKADKEAAAAAPAPVEAPVEVAAPAEAPAEAPVEVAAEAPVEQLAA